MYREIKERKLRELCAELRLDIERCDAVFYLATVTIREFETIHKPRIKSAAETVNSLNRIDELANRLAAEIWGLGSEQIAIGRHLAECGITLEFSPPGHLDFLSDALPGHKGVLRLCDTLLTVAGAAIDIRDAIPSPKRGGRKSTQSQYASFVGQLAVIVSGCEISTGRGGSFERLCTAVFSAGDVGQNPENAIRFYQKHFRDLGQEIKSASEAGNSEAGTQPVKTPS